jgi:4-hydroxybenzoate polyprenyltransferase
MQTSSVLDEAGALSLAKAAFKLIRPHQWAKNGFVLLGTLFSHRFDLYSLGQTALVFCAFCAAASAVYVFNDIFDAESDRAHPKKRNRPIASGKFPVSYASLLGMALATISGALAWKASAAALAIICAYGFINVLYTVKLKNVVVVDVFIIAAGFMLRILIGTVGLGIAPSSWLLLCGMMVTLFLGFTKRRAELLAFARRPEGRRRQVLASYNPVILDQFQSITAASAVLTYALYTVSHETVALHGTSYLIYTVPFVVYGIFRYLLLLHSDGNGEDTASDIFRDWHLSITALAWLTVTVWIIL